MPGSTYAAAPAIPVPVAVDHSITPTVSKPTRGVKKKVDYKSMESKGFEGSNFIIYAYEFQMKCLL